MASNDIQNNEDDYSIFYLETEKNEQIIYKKTETYKNPFVDHIFKKIFEKKKYLIDLLNAVLKLKDNDQICKIEYLTEQIFEDDERIRKIVKKSKGRTRSKTTKEENQNYEIVEEETKKKKPVVDVRCCDFNGNEYLIEMQVYRENYFLRRVMLNNSKVYSSFFESGKEYDNNKNVYSINILDHILFYPEKGLKYKKNYYHFDMREEEDRNLKMEGEEYFFIELPRFNIKNYNNEEDKRLRLWQRFFTSYNHTTKSFDLTEEELNDELISNVVEDCRLRLIKEAALHYNKFEAQWEIIEKQKKIIEEQKIENEKQKKENEEKSKKIEEQNKLISQLLQQLEEKNKNNN